ncbi:SusC/RagA family TonB-linked outer membrane protein [Reichenbachiella versicolor]|uniref:SusC/RagA family TonB-linked outer membrane protein n=1 Tax=Reichenbachiella versicolor TaxID=1821036 RepID=UPI000D6DCE02|nr:TonB-dependent receptor [Reichenbachiella versicolor]
MKLRLLVKRRISLRCYCLALLLALTCGFVQAQDVMTIKGNVQGAGEALPGVNVLIKGESGGSVTDIDGNYSVNVKSGDVLIFSFIGFKSQEITVNTQSEINILLEADVKSLDEVVVVGYGSQKKKELTGAVNNVDSEVIGRSPTPDLGTALQGQVAGVNIQAASGAPGATANIQIRGVRSLSGQNEPLYVVDGIPQAENPNIPPSQIESIDILKDGASASIYGARGTNGVIIITTKKGTPGKTRIDFAAWGGIQNITSGTELSGTEDWFFVDQVRVNEGGQNYGILSRTPNALQNDTDFVGVIQKDNAPIQNYELNVSGGKGPLQVNASLNYFNQEGVLVNSGFERLTSRLTGQINNKKFKMFMTIGVTEENRDREPFAIYEQAIRQRPYNPEPANLDLSGGGVIVPEEDPTTYSFFATQLINTDEQKLRRVNVAVNASYEFFKGFTYNIRLGQNTSNTIRKQFQPKVLIYNINEELSGASREQALLNEDYRWFSNAIFENFVRYNKTWGKHDFKATAALTFEKWETKDVGLGGTFAANGNNDIQVPGAIVETQNPTSNDTEYSLIGQLGRLEYDYDDRYLFQAIVRRDGSSNFQDKWAYFPSVSAGWNIGDESFWNINQINALKLRVSLGTGGNNRTQNPYVSVATIDGGVNYLAGTSGTLAPGLIQRSLANPDVSWETSVSRNIGVDLGAFQNRVQFTADFYFDTNQDMLLPKVVPLSTGTNVTGAANAYNFIQVNGGEMTNKGMGLSLLYRDKTSFGLEYDLSATFSKVVNEITDLDGLDIGYGGGTPVQTIGGVDNTTFFATGYEAGSFFLIETDGVIKSDVPDGDTYGFHPETGEELSELTAYQLIESNAQLGDLKYVDQLTEDTDGDGIMDAGDSTINTSDRVYKGSGLPDFEMGLTAALRYKGFDFTVQGYYSHGAEIYNGARFLAHNFGRSAEQVGMWSAQNSDSDIPTFRDNRTHPNARAWSDRWLEDGTYFRIRTITLGYTFKGLEKYGITKARVYASTVNPFTFTKYTGYDPEVGGNGLSTRGVDRGNYPVTRQFLIGAQLSF